jgi:hypothetical protein
MARWEEIDKTYKDKVTNWIKAKLGSGTNGSASLKVVQVSDDGNEWRDVLRGELPSTFAPQQIEFSRVTTAKYLKLISLSGFGADKTTALAELAVIQVGTEGERKKPKH